MADRVRLFIGRYTEGDDSPESELPGITVAEFDPERLTIEPVGAAQLAEASFLALSAAGDVLYAVSEHEDGQVAAFGVGGGRGELTPLGAQPTDGGQPCHLMIDPSGRFLLAANYGTGSLSVFPIGASGAPGELSHLAQHEGSGPETDRQAEAHAHIVTPTPAGDAYLSADLGADSIYVYSLDGGSGRLVLRARNQMRAGTGPRHLVFHPSGEYFYLANELSNTVSVCAYDRATGEVKEVAELPAAPHPEDARNYPSGIVLTPDAHYLYVGNRGDESISAFEVSATGDRLRTVGRWSCEGSWPRHLTLSPDSGFLFSANQRSHDIAVFRADPYSGQLSFTGLSYRVRQPAHVLFG
jgi:6-phosphogluconolactonase